jgi:hypothetical protein
MEKKNIFCRVSLCPQPVENFFIHFATAKFCEYNVMNTTFTSLQE